VTLATPSAASTRARPPEARARREHAHSGADVLAGGARSLAPRRRHQLDELAIAVRALDAHHGIGASGIIAPVEIAQASLARASIQPARRRATPTTASRAPAPLSAARTAKPSIAELSNPGTSAAAISPTARPGLEQR